jgi:hypothetical protein
MPDNIPTALQDAPIPLLAAPDWQMSFGERAALEGVLSQLRPRLAVEVGSAEGGSLRRIARHSACVHSFDLVPPAPGVAQRPNVTLHTGDSHRLLREWLSTVGAPLDFALVDGDHSRKGVGTDLAQLLDAACAQRTVVLLHDSAHPETRDGILDALHGRPVAYCDLDFYPGYTFARGSFADERWGGLALLVTGASQRQKQDLYYHL